MIRVLGVVSLFFLVGCGGIIPNTRAITSQGFRVVVRNIELLDTYPDYDAIDIQISATVEAFSKEFNIPEEDILKVFQNRGVVFVVELDPFTIFCPTEELPERRCAGMYHRPGYIVITWHNKKRDGDGIWVPKNEPFCVADTALSHELTHLLAAWINGYSDTNHENPRLFKPGGVSTVGAMNTAEAICPWKFENLEE